MKGKILSQEGRKEKEGRKRKEGREERSSNVDMYHHTP